ncbi:MAG: dihydroneopterin aldolase [Spirochaetota bacterium]
MERIVVQDLRVRAHLGVTERERRRKQKVLVCVELVPASPYPMTDRLQDTVDYSTVRRELRDLAGARGCHLIETLAGRMADQLIERFPVAGVTVTIKKFPYPDAAYVSYTTGRAPR